MLRKVERGHSCPNKCGAFQSSLKNPVEDISERLDFFQKSFGQECPRSNKIAVCVTSVNSFNAGKLPELFLIRGDWREFAGRKMNFLIIFP